MSCSPSQKNRSAAASATAVSEKDAYLQELLGQYPEWFGNALENSRKWNVQIIYTQVNRRANGRPQLVSHFFNADTAYFYPASTVKLPVALLALQKLNELKDKGISRNTTMLTEAAYSGQTAVYNDPNTADGRPTIAQYIKKIFLVSDNDAFNRLYEFLGQEYINAELHKKGYTEAEVRHRLAVFLSETENRHTNPVNFYDNAGKIVYSQPLLNNTAVYKERHDSQGKAYYASGQLVNAPMDFSKKNKLPLQDLHNMLISLVFPNSVAASKRFNLSADDRNFVLRSMSQFPGESLYPHYDSKNYPDAFSKFIFYGAQKGALPKNIRIFNKVGNAYGQLVDAAYVVDFENKIEFFVSAAITCNTDGILNDDKYDYDTIGFPFMKNLGKVLYEQELKRAKKRTPDLSAFMFTYDK